MKRVLSYLKFYKGEAVFGPLLKLAEAVLDLLVPLIMATVIDHGIGNHDTDYIVWMCLLLVGMGVVGLAMAISAQYFSAKAAVGVATRIRRALFSKVQSLSYTELDRVGENTLITRMTGDVNQIQSGINLALRLLLRSPFIVFGAVVMALFLDTQGALIILASIPLLAAVVFAVLLVSIPLYRKAQEWLDRLTGKTRETLSGARVLRAFGMEAAESAAFAADNRSLTGAQRLAGRVTALLNPLTYIIVNLAILVLIHSGAIRVEAGLLSQGAVVALYNYMLQILVELIKLANLIINITRSVACAKRVDAVLAMPVTNAEKDGAVPARQGAVCFDNVSLTYAGAAAPTLSAISFCAAAGETVGIIGGTGSGKTSLVNLIPRFYDATEGCVRVDGEDVRTLSASALRKQIGVVPQKSVLFKGTIRDNLRFGNETATDEELWAALDAAQARNVVAGKEEGLDAPVEQNGRNFSGGQRQRLTIARALVRKPAVLILDDSASALDYATDANLRAALRELPFSPTVFIVSQRTSSLKHADHIVVLDEGKMVGIGTHEELLASCDVYREIHLSQTKEVTPYVE